MPLSPETIRELWAHADAYLAIAERELDPSGIRRGLVTLAVAGSGGDEEGFRRQVIEVRRVARTIADMEGSPQIQENHVAEAVQYRLLDRKF